MSRGRTLVADHDFQPVAGHPDDDECTYRSDGTDATYCGRTQAWHSVACDDYDYPDWVADQHGRRTGRISKPLPDVHGHDLG